MHKYIKFLLVVCFFAVNAAAQNNNVTLKTETTTDGNILINATNLSNCRYTVIIYFTELSGFSNLIGTNTYMTTINEGNTQLLKLVTDKNAGSRALNYRYTYYPGIAFRKAPNSYAHYLLPLSEHKTTRASKISSISKIFDQTTDSDVFSDGFTYKLGDTICASRAGIIYNIFDESKEGEGRNTYFSSQRNNIGIQHKDGTVGRYSLLAPIKSLVENGDFVIPGQPIAYFNKESDKYILLFAVFYLDESKLKSENNKEVYKVLPANFYINDVEHSIMLQGNQTYTNTKSEKIIVEELSKKEKKKLGVIE
jgi:hypothetical protein